jgi:hypothetical protein
MITKQEYLLSVPFDYIIGFSKETGLIRNNRYFTKKDFVHRLLASLETSECRQIYNDYKNGQSYKKSVEWFLTKFPTGQSISKRFVESQSLRIQQNFSYEFPVSKTRVDILGLLGRFHAYEVKSQRDNFDRLAYQIPALKLFFEHVSIIIPCDTSPEIIKSIDEDIGVVLFSTENQKIDFQYLREASNLDEYSSHAQLCLLQTEELRKIYARLIERPVNKLGRHDLVCNIFAKLSRTEINDLFKLAIYKRQRLSSEQIPFEYA